MTICAISGHFRWRVAAILFLFLALLSHTFAQGAAPPMQTPIDLGAVPESQMLTVKVWIKLLPGRAAALDGLIAARQESSSASHRTWATPDEFRARFGATDEQIVSAAEWLERQGLAAGQVLAGKTRIAVTGSGARMQGAFEVKLGRYSDGGRPYFANADAPKLPSDIAG